MLNNSSNIAKFIKSDYKHSKDPIHDIKDIKRLYEIIPKSDYHIDDQTFSDLNLEDLFRNMDKSYSSPGESALYCLLRNLSIDKDFIKKRGKIIDFFSDNENTKLNVHKQFFRLGFNIKNSFIDMLTNDIKVNKLKYYLYTVLGKIIPALIILLFIYTREPRLILVLAASLCLNTFIISTYEEKNIKNNGLCYLSDMFKTAKNIINLNVVELSDSNNKLSRQLKELNKIKRVVEFLNLNSSLGGLFESLSMPFLLSESAYYKISGELLNKREVLFQLYYTLGEIEALISISTFKSNLKCSFCTPDFISDTSLTVTDAYHPLLKNPVANSISIDKHGIILTGTNMSGKSTFLRTVGLNIIFSQCFNFALAKSYKAPLLNLVSSISPNDDVVLGKSYFMAEAESLLRIINATQRDIPVFCIIDEIFRGTNPIERISSSAEILKYINNHNALCIVATHDKELTEILKSNYDFYYFGESVDSSSGLSFDYKLKPGISKSMNAIKLLDYLGYPKNIINDAYKRAENINGYI